jgi:tetratricopeptide (TPR) repeat protein
LVDSLPLGIVIAAGWVQHMPPAEISRMMQKDLLQVESVYSDIPSRHQSFQGLLNAMLAHISEQERQALTCLSIFDGSFDFKAALAVAAISPNDFKDLTNKCLVQHTGAFRYHVHSIVRQAFRSQLERSASLQDVSMRYIAYFQQWCDDLYAQGLLLHELTHVIDVEQHNLWEVVGASETERLRFILHIAPAMYEYWVNRGYHARGVVQLLQAGGNHPDIALETRIRGLITLARILERTSQYDLAWTTCEQVLQLEAALNMPEIKARALRVLSEICVRQSHYDRASEYLHTIIGMESQTSIPTNPQIQRLIALAYEDLGEMLISQGEYEAARYYIEIAIRRWVERGESLREAIAQSYLGIIALKRKEYDSAYQLFDAILAQAQKAKNHTLITIFSTHLGTAAMNRGNYAQAHSLFRDALQIAIQIDRKVSMIQIIERLSLLALFHHRDEIAAQLFGFAASMRERLRIPVTPHNQQDHLQHQGDLMERLGQAFDRNYETGRALSLTTVIQLAPSVFDSANVV